MLGSHERQGIAVIDNPLIGEFSFDVGAESGGWVSPGGEVRYTCVAGEVEYAGVCEWSWCLETVCLHKLGIINV